MKRKIFIFILLFTTYIYTYSYFYASKTSADIEKNVFRLHIIANSDSVEDQNLKYKVRDNIISYMNTICENTSSKEETILIAQNHINDFKSIADKTIIAEGFNYISNVEIGNYKFPTKYYGDIAFPSGYYDAMEIKIGNSSGKNWWCVLYPSLCFVDVSSGTVPESSKLDLKENLSEEEYALISEDTPTYNLKFKLVELFNNNFILGKGKV